MRRAAYPAEDTTKNPLSSNCIFDVACYFEIQWQEIGFN